MTTPLAAILRRRIALQGPLSVAEFMSECLLHPRHGYYATRDPFGTAGDFTTAPEISQMFGELLGLCLAQAWIVQGKPAPFVLSELGPGRGTLMADLLRATSRVEGFHAGLRLHLVEASAKLRARQAEVLSGHEPLWHDSIDDLPEMPLFLLANEFFDALPIRQFLRSESGWRERVIGLDGDGRLAFGLSEAVPLMALSHRLDDTREGDLVELCPAASVIASLAARRIAAHGGAALIVDYGGWRSLGDTLQALYRHRPDDPLAHPGEADLTAHVDFEPIARAAHAAGTATTGLTAQGALLERLGISARARALAQSLAGSALENHLAAYHRLTAPDEMGTLFRALALHPRSVPAPPGFDPNTNNTAGPDA